MKDFLHYLALSVSALLPLVNPPGTALELLGIVGVGATKPYKALASKMALNAMLFLTIIALGGPYVLQFFGISVEILQFVGGAVVAAMGWQLLNKPEEARETRDAGAVALAQDCIATYWRSRAFYPLTFPFTVGPGSVAVTLALSAQANTLGLHQRIPAFAGLFVCFCTLSVLVYICCAYAPATAKKLPASIVNGSLRIIAFLLICVGAQIAWHGLRSLLLAM
jgi:multiple antibiotic resistance protein